MQKPFKPSKQRQRNASGIENLRSLIATLAYGNGTLHDRDQLKASHANPALPGLSEITYGRRIGEKVACLRLEQAIEPIHVSAAASRPTFLMIREALFASELLLNLLSSHDTQFYAPTTHLTSS